MTSHTRLNVTCPAFRNLPPFHSNSLQLPNEVQLIPVGRACAYFVSATTIYYRSWVGFTATSCTSLSLPQQLHFWVLLNRSYKPSLCSSTERCNLFCFRAAAKQHTFCFRTSARQHQSAPKPGITHPSVPSVAANFLLSSHPAGPSFAHDVVQPGVSMKDLETIHDTTREL